MIWFACLKAQANGVPIGTMQLIMGFALPQGCGIRCTLFLDSWHYLLHLTNRTLLDSLSCKQYTHLRNFCEIRSLKSSTSKWKLQSQNGKLQKHHQISVMEDVETTGTLWYPDWVLHPIYQLSWLNFHHQADAHRSRLNDFIQIFV